MDRCRVVREHTTRHRSQAQSSQQHGYRSEQLIVLTLILVGATPLASQQELGFCTGGGLGLVALLLLLLALMGRL